MKINDNSQLTKYIQAYSNDILPPQKIKKIKSAHRENLHWGDPVQAASTETDQTAHGGGERD